MKNFILIPTIAGFVFIPQASFAKTCIPAHNFVKVDHKGSYHRIHPSGDFVLFTGGDPRVSLIDLRGVKDGKGEAKIIPTVLRGESYPVEPNWKYITSPDQGIQKRLYPEETGLAFYSFEKLIDKTPQNYKEARPEMNDPENEGYYHSVAERPSSDGTMRIRATRWNKNEKIEYQVKKGPNGKSILERGPKSQFCSNLTKKHEAAAVEAEKAYYQAFARLNDGKVVQPPLSPEAVQKLEAERDEKEQASIRAKGFVNLANPILSKDGQFLAIRYGIPFTVKVYRLAENGDCENEIDTGYEGSKVSFSYPEPGKLPKIVFTADDWLGKKVETEKDVKIESTGKKVILYDLETRKSYPVNKESEPFAESPGFTKDGRIIYSTGTGLAIVDSKRILRENKDCIETTTAASRTADPQEAKASTTK